MTLSIKDINNIEAEDGVDEYDYFASVQRAINAGAWSFQGSYGRAMREAIKDGLCVLGIKDLKYYYGNTIPSRTNVKAGTKGSEDYVKEAHGQDWLDFVLGLQ